MAEVRLEIDAAHPLERVWRALTDAELLAEWFMPTDLEPREGTRFTFEPGTLPGFLGPVAGELTELVPPHRLVMLWQGDKLYTKVTWELIEVAGGCRVQIVQSGFIGAPATLRRRALRDTYTRLFAEQLPAVLDRLAGGEHESGAADAGVLAAGAQRVREAAASGFADLHQEHPLRQALAAGGTSLEAPGEELTADHFGPSPSSPSPAHSERDQVPGGPPSLHRPSGAMPSGAARRRNRPESAPPYGLEPDPDEAPTTGSELRAAVPRQRRAPGNVAVTPWSAGRTLSPPPAAEPAGDAASTASARAQHTDTPPAGSGEPEREASADRPAGGWARWRARLMVAPGWLRAIAIGAATAVFAVLVLAAMVHTPGGDDVDGLPGAEGAKPGGPEVAVQPGEVTSHTAPAGSPEATDPSGGAPGSPEAAGSPGAPGATSATSAGGGGDRPGQPAPEQTTGPGEPEPTPQPALSAEMTTTGLPLLGSRAVAVTVSNPGPGAAPGWEVVMDVGDQDVSDVDGASYRRDGSQVIFTPTSGELAAGESDQFEFHVGGLLLASDPTNCTIDGEPCG